MTVIKARSVLMEQLNHAQWHIPNVPGADGVSDWVTVLALALAFASSRDLAVRSRSLNGDCRIMMTGGGR